MGISRYLYNKTLEIGNYRIEFLWPKHDTVCGRFGCGWDYSFGIEISKFSKAVKINLIIAMVTIYYI